MSTYRIVKCGSIFLLAGLGFLVNRNNILATGSIFHSRLILQQNTGIPTNILCEVLRFRVNLVARLNVINIIPPCTGVFPSYPIFEVSSVGMSVGL